MTIGVKIKKARTTAGLTQKELAEKSGVAAVTIQQYERGVRQPRIEQLEKLANALGISPSDLLNMPDWGNEKNNIDIIVAAAAEWSKGIVNGTPNKELAGELLDEIEDVVSLGDVNQEIEYFRKTQERINSALNLLNMEGLSKAAELIEGLAQKPIYQRNLVNDDEDAYADFARQQRLLEKEQASQTLSAKESDAG